MSGKFKPVEIGCSRAGNFFLALCDVKEHWLVRLWPLKVKTFLYTVGCRNIKQTHTIQDCVEDVQQRTLTDVYLKEGLTLLLQER